MKVIRALIILLFVVAFAALWSPGRAFAASDETAGGTHVVKRGETLSAIAVRYGVSVNALARANNIRNRNRIFVGQRLRIPGRSGNAPAPAQPVQAPANAVGAKWIEIDLSSQRLIAHQGNSVLMNTRISSGLPRTPTPVGRYSVRTKVRSQTMSGPGYRLPNVQWVMYFIGDYALHGTYWHNNFGHPMSHGCVNLTNRDARFLYNWANYGTPVVVHR
ncbi:MAG: L,D-transpeptidase family protein [Caldilineales bacterium]|nr:L,D-transpeptidase family protein [Caldilineales bacterium]